MNKFIIHSLYVIPTQSLHTRHFVHELQQESVQARIVISATVNQLEQSREARFVDHAREQRLLVVAVEKQKARYGRQRTRLVLLKKAVYDLLPHVVLMVAEELALEQHLYGGNHVAVGVAAREEGRCRLKPCAQGIVERFVVIAGR